MIKVVVVEDEEFIRRGMILTTPWEEFDCEVIGEARNGIEGINLIKKLNPDIVITDVRMPIMDGIMMINELTNFVEAEYIIVSGFDDFKYAQQAIKLGVKDYLLKPIDDTEFYNTLRKIIEVVKGKQDHTNTADHYSQISNCKLQFFKEYEFELHYDSRKKYVFEAVEYIKTNYYREITLRDAADSLYISESYLSRLFKTHTSYTFIEYLTSYRIKMAISLLKDHRIKVYEVSDKVGYKDSKYFSVIFKKYIGVTPLEFKYSVSH
ncbi:MAG: DNA-binding response regulator [Firmicutes bacterium HGW-Firmicutes-1]|jgi:two-component system response regulator YesN|nr:MAG: DNA-binding response regulator [Firmicutes bacterium HGW-Firmicutes-1]